MPIVLFCRHIQQLTCEYRAIFASSFYIWHDDNHCASNEMAKDSLLEHQMVETDMFVDRRATILFAIRQFTCRAATLYTSLIQDLYLIFHQIVRFLAVGTYST